MTWFVDEYGLANFRDMPVEEMDRLAQEQGVQFYATLTGLILHEGVQASAITPISAENLYDGVVAMRQGGTEGLEPVAVAWSYNVEALNGQRLEPAVPVEEVRQAYWANELARIGERKYHVAVLECPETGAQLYFKAARAREVEAQLAAAVREIYPEEESLYTALQNHDLQHHQGTAIGRHGDGVLARLEDEGGARFFLGANATEVESKALRAAGGAPGEDIGALLARREEVDFTLGLMAQNEEQIATMYRAHREAESSPDLSPGF